jgi:hypothetical protein
VFNVCEIAFEPVVGAVTDTCDDEDHGFRVDYRYDGETRAIESLNFGSVRHVDLEILVAENLPPLVEVHHDVVVQKCTYDCARGEPLVARVQLSPAAPPDAGADGGEGVPDATVDAALDAAR